MIVVVGLVTGTDPHSRAIAQAAAKQAFPNARVLEFAALEDAWRHEGSGQLDLLVVAGLGAAGLARAGVAAHEDGPRRGAIVALAGSAAGEGVETVAEEDWNVPLLTRVFRLAVERQRLQWENARLRGDLRTIARRIMHDLRTPLGGILSAGEALKEVLSEHPPSSSALVTPLFESVEDMQRLMERVILLTKASLDPVVKGPVAMGEIVFRVLQRLERRISSQGFVVAHADRWPEVEGVPAWIESVWSNLLVNALQHGKGGARLELGWSEAACGIRFWLIHPTSRVPPEKLPTLFQPFHSLHQSNARRGLGLSIVERLMELQGGTCGYEPLAADGCVFFFTLPAKPPAEGTGASADLGNARRSPLSQASAVEPSSRGGGGEEYLRRGR